MEYTSLIIWGFLAGFVGWAAFPRLPGMIVQALFSFRADAKNLRVVATVLVIGFLLLSVFFVLLLMPMFLMIARGGTTGHRLMGWRGMFELTFVSSLAGYLAHGLVRKFGSDA